MIRKLSFIRWPMEQPSQDGFTLIEAVIAVAVLSIGILTLSVMQAGSVRGNARASQITTASAWAAQRMEQLNAMAYEDDQLDDVRNDGTDQDADLNGIDDDDDGPGRDTIPNFGLDQNTTATADFTIADDPDLPGFTIHHNIAVDQPIENMKTIRIILIRNTDQQQFVFDYFKAAAL